MLEEALRATALHQLEMGVAGEEGRRREAGVGRSEVKRRKGGRSITSSREELGEEEVSGKSKCGGGRGGVKEHVLFSP